LTTSLRLKPDIRGHVVSADEVALLSEGGKFALRGKVYAAIIPLLDGKKNNDTIVGLLSSRFNPALIYFALDELKSKKYVVAAEPGDTELDAAAWWSSHDVAYEAWSRYPIPPLSWMGGRIRQPSLPCRQPC